MSGTLLEAVAEVSRVTGNVALAYFQERVRVEIKADKTPVTVADKTAESTARAWIESRFPDDGILGEEFGETRPGAKRRWVLDPIDGTKTFIRGVPLWGTLVAVMEGEKVLAGGAYFPAVNELVVAAPGQGVFLNGRKCAVSTVASMDDALVLTTDPRFPNQPDRAEAYGRLQKQAPLSRSWGDCYGYLLVATGRAEAMMDPILSIWDAAALQPIIEEAGGVFTDWEGRATVMTGSAVATNRALAKNVRAILGGSPQ